MSRQVSSNLFSSESMRDKRNRQSKVQNAVHNHVASPALTTSPRNNLSSVFASEAQQTASVLLNVTNLTRQNLDQKIGPGPSLALCSLVGDEEYQNSLQQRLLSNNPGIKQDGVRLLNELEVAAKEAFGKTEQGVEAAEVALVQSKNEHQVSTASINVLNALRKQFGDADNFKAAKQDGAVVHDTKGVEDNQGTTAPLPVFPPMTSAATSASSAPLTTSRRFVSSSNPFVSSSNPFGSSTMKSPGTSMSASESQEAANSNSNSTTTIGGGVASAGGASATPSGVPLGRNGGGSSTQAASSNTSGNGSVFNDTTNNPVACATPNKRREEYTVSSLRKRRRLDRQG